jgi:hypothetical protein
MLKALEYGSIPVMDDFEFFKGCESPTHYLKVRPSSNIYKLAKL